jgi:hypothetical protein
MMYQHHTESIHKAAEYFQAQPGVEALILGGSVAHGLAGPASDIDVMIVVSPLDYEQRLRTGRLAFFDRELCTYPDGYVDGKYVSAAFLQKVADRGSEPARFAFLDARVLFARMDGLAEVLQAIARYPAAGKTERMRRFSAQLEAWHWYAHEALKRSNRYLLGLALSKLVLFGGRLILAHNEMLYPYHKWFLQILERAQDRPQELLNDIGRLYDSPSPESITAFYEAVKKFRDWPVLEAGWPSQFMLDSELGWLNGYPAVDDL